MSKLLVTGRKKLDGEVEVQGAKNSALPIIAASILTKGENEILALPVRARIAPRKTIELLVLRINSTGTSKRLISSHFTRSVLSQRVTAQPRYRRMLTDASTSESEGQLWITFSPFVRIEADVKSVQDRLICISIHFGRWGRIFVKSTAILNVAFQTDFAEQR